MYPVMSMLRRAAGKLVYVREEHLHLQGGEAFIRLQSKANWVRFGERGWQKPLDLVPLFTLSVEADSREQTAWMLTKAENEHAELFNAKEVMFTLVLGEETESQLETGRYRRVFRAGILRGLFHHPRTGEPLERIPAKRTQGATFRRLPPGVVPERR
jgi:hypothetical protein